MTLMQLYSRFEQRFSAEAVPIVRVQMGLAEDASQRAHRNIVFLWHDSGVGEITGSADEFDVAALLAHFDETGRFKPSLDLAERQGPKSPEPRPR